MKHIGIVAEYNPFHNGHAYQFEQIKKQFPDKQILVIMSGNFVQRGEPAIYEKTLRATCALLAGADLVFELPVYYSIASAEYFAAAAIRLLAATGIVDTVCFGAECDNLSILDRIADILCNEPSKYQSALKYYLSKGYNFPKSRALAITDYFGTTDYSAVLDQPNNILAIEYLKTIKRFQLPLTPVVIKRKNSCYHNHKLTEKFPSATALRHNLKKEYDKTHSFTKQTLLLPKEFLINIPLCCHSFLSENVYAKPLFFSDFYPVISYALWANQKNYDNFFDISNELSNHLDNLYSYNTNIEKLIEAASCKNYTKSRIKRTLFYILFNIKKNENAYDKSTNSLSYLRLLGFRSSASYVLHEMKMLSSIPVINKTAHADRILTDSQYEAFEKELQIHALYKQIFEEKYGIAMPSEYRQSVIITDL